MAPTPSYSPAKKKVKLLADTAWEHFRNYIDSCQQDDNDDGDLDELTELLGLLEPALTANDNAKGASFSSSWELSEPSTTSMLPLLCSVAHYHLATAVQDTQSSTKLLQHLQASLRWFPQNGAAWSMGANYARIKQLQSTPVIAQWYHHAAACAHEVRREALKHLDREEVDQDEMAKEWLELLVMNAITGSYYDDEDDGFSVSCIESTSRFMAAMLFSTLRKHCDAKEELQHFDLSHRLHPNVWDKKLSTSNHVTDTCWRHGNVLPNHLHQRMCQVFAPDANYWKESEYENRGYYSYFFARDDQRPLRNLIEEVVCHYLLPLAQKQEEIVGFEWWAHTRPIQANLGHNLHFDTDESGLDQDGVVTHPVFSSVLYLTAGGTDKDDAAGVTVIMQQAPDSELVAPHAWISQPRENTYTLFPGNLLHGVLPCPGKHSNAQVDKMPNVGSKNELHPLDWKQAEESDSSPPHRLTFMVGFWTRNVPEKMTNRKLYGPCGPLPPAETTKWVQEICEGYPQKEGATTHPTKTTAAMPKEPLPHVFPVWESISSPQNRDDKFLEIPCAIDHRFFVKNAPHCFHESLFEKDEEEEEDGDQNNNDDDDNDDDKEGKKHDE